MEWQARLNRAFDYIEAHLEGELRWEEAAAEALCSTFHFLRMFEVVAGVGPGEYVRSRRLSRAAQELTLGRPRVIDVALRSGYESPEAFGKAFKREFGISPSEAREPGATLKTWPRLVFSIVLKGSEAMEYRIENREGFRMVGLPLKVKMAGAAGVPEDKGLIGRFWEKAMKDGSFATLLRLMPRASKLGVMGACVPEADPKSCDFTYLIAIEAPAEKAGLPGGLCRGGGARLDLGDFPLPGSRRPGDPGDLAADHGRVVPQCGLRAAGSARSRGLSFRGCLEGRQPFRDLGAGEKGMKEGASKPIAG